MVCEMAAAAKQKQQPKPDLKADIERLRADLLAYLESRVAVMKQGRDGANLPIEALRHHLLRGDDCWCRAVTRLLDESV
jgi:hypothetical protein